MQRKDYRTGVAGWVTTMTGRVDFLIRSSGTLPSSRSATAGRVLEPTTIRSACCWSANVHDALQRRPEQHRRLASTPGRAQPLRHRLGGLSGALREDLRGAAASRSSSTSSTATTATDAPVCLARPATASATHGWSTPGLAATHDEHVVRRCSARTGTASIVRCSTDRELWVRQRGGTRYGGRGNTAGTLERDQPALKRVMGPGLLLLFVVGDILGTGVYALTGKVAGEVGGAVWLPFLCAFVVALLTATSYLELVTKYPQAGGAALYTHKAFGIHFLTFMLTFAVMCSGLTSASSASKAFAANFLPRRLRPRRAATALMLTALRSAS